MIIRSPNREPASSKPQIYFGRCVFHSISCLIYCERVSQCHLPVIPDPGILYFIMDPQIPASPTYRIFRDPHGIPQFEPKRGTQGLKDALIYAFPSLETELQLMQAALRKFFDSERGSTFVFELPERDLQTSLAKKRDIPISPAQTGKASLRSWKLSRASRTPSRPSSRASSRGPSRASSRAPSRASSRCETPTPFQEMAVPVSGGTMTTWVLSNGQELEKRKRQPYDAVKRRKVAENRGNACEKHRASKTAVSCLRNPFLLSLIDCSATQASVLKINCIRRLQNKHDEIVKVPHTTRRLKT